MKKLRGIALVCTVCLLTIFANTNPGPNPIVWRLNGRALHLTLTGGGGTEVSSSFDRVISIAGSPPGGNSLDMAYDKGGPGQGRTIVADTGGVEILGGDGLTTAGPVGVGAAPHWGMLRVDGELATLDLRVDGDLSTGGISASKLSVARRLSSGTVDVGGVARASAAEIRGPTTTAVLTVPAGSDVAEPFPVREAGQIEPGSVLVIDDRHAGWLEVSDRPYDRRVAGIVSGAGHLRPGVVLTQRARGSSQRVVTLKGRAFVLADAAQGPIRPGDLLTTSFRRGHVMKVSGSTPFDGAVVGKAMSPLDDGQGYVLVLVGLQ